MIRVYGLMAATFLILDIAWIGGVAADFYRQQLGHLLRPRVRWGPALLFYALYLAGILIFAVMPAVENESFARALLLGGFFGLVAYATFDLTSLALIEGFPTRVVIVDLVWGTALTASVAMAGYGAARWLGVGP